MMWIELAKEFIGEGSGMAYGVWNRRPELQAGAAECLAGDLSRKKLDLRGWASKRRSTRLNNKLRLKTPQLKNCLKRPRSILARVLPPTSWKHSCARN